MSDEQITIPKATAQILFDALVHSMDFGSGFLDTQEVEALRGMAAALGVDPREATPLEFIAQYPHAFKFTGFRTEAAECEVGPYSRRCRKPENDPIHQATQMGA